MMYQSKKTKNQVTICFLNRKEEAQTTRKLSQGYDD